MDLRANLDRHRVRNLWSVAWYRQDSISLACRTGQEAQIRPRRTGLEKRDYRVELTGTIDADYRGEICIILVNLSSSRSRYGTETRMHR